MEDFQELDAFFADYFGQQRLPQLREFPEDDTSDTDTESTNIVEQTIREVLDCEQNTTSEDEIDNSSPASDIQSSIASGCGCTKSCLCNLSSQDIEDHVNNLRELDTEAREMYVLGSLHKIHPNEKRTRYGDRKRDRYNYIYEGHHLCRKAFCVIYDVPERTLQRMVKHLNENGNVPRIHGNKGRKPAHALKFEDAERVVQYLVTYGEEDGLPQPAAPRGRDDTPPVFLKSSNTKKLIHANYQSMCQENGHRAVQLKSFTRIWNHCCPHIKIAKPQDDCCGKCEVLRKRVADARTDEDKLQTSTELQEHILAANIEHQVYKSCVTKSVAELEDIDIPAEPVMPCTTDYQHCHYTFDFAQNVCLPHHARQMGPLYFLSLRKVHIFGVRDDGVRRQYNYIVDEGETMSHDGKGLHGPNGVISMLDHALTHFTHGEKVTTLQSDNCTGSIVKMLNVLTTDEDKLQTSTELQEHILAANIEHQVYKSCVTKSVAELEDIDIPAEPVMPCTTDYQHCHYTFDFAQNVCLPHHARQMGPLYFLSLRKVHIFGVRDDGVRRQYNYIVEEGETMSHDGKGLHGPNGVISMLDHALTHFTHGEKVTTLQSDNCTGQNKNRYVLAYLAWRTMTGQNEDIKLLMMIPGHARCLVDSGFGLMKKLYRRSDCETLDDIEHAINLSSRTNRGVRYMKDGHRNWEWRDWKSFLSTKFGAVRGIRGFQQFRFSAQNPGTVFAKRSGDADEMQINFCKDRNVTHDRLAPMPSVGLGPERTAYLARYVRPYLRDCNKDATCPEE